MRRLIDAWSAHDRANGELLHPDAVFHSAITNVVGETFEGRDQILAVFDRWEEEWSEIRWEVDEYIDADERRVVTLHKVIATGRASGIDWCASSAGCSRSATGWSSASGSTSTATRPSKPRGWPSRRAPATAASAVLLDNEPLAQ